MLAKDEAKHPRLKEVLYNLTETIAIAASLLAPFMPETSAKVLEQINCPEREYTALGEFGLYPDGNKVQANAEVIFARLDQAEVDKKAEEIKNKYVAAEKVEQEEEKSEITIDDFAKIQFRTALVTACEKVEKSKKLLKLSLNVGKNVVLVYNLKPAKLCGVESQGMILCAEKDGKLSIVSPEKGEIPDGATVR